VLLISSCPVAVLETVIEAVTLIVFALELLGSPREIAYLDSGRMMTLHFGRAAYLSRRSAMGRKSRGKRRMPVS
jgi:hypothetical protein